MLNPRDIKYILVGALSFVIIYVIHVLRVMMGYESF